MRSKPVDGQRLGSFDAAAVAWMTRPGLFRHDVELHRRGILTLDERGHRRYHRAKLEAWIGRRLATAAVASITKRAPRDRRLGAIAARGVK